MEKIMPANADNFIDGIKTTRQINMKTIFTWFFVQIGFVDKAFFCALRIDDNTHQERWVFEVQRDEQRAIERDGEKGRECVCTIDWNELVDHNCSGKICINIKEAATHFPFAARWIHFINSLSWQAIHCHSGFWGLGLSKKILSFPHSNVWIGVFVAVLLWFMSSHKIYLQLSYKMKQNRSSFFFLIEQ